MRSSSVLHFTTLCGEPLRMLRRRVASVILWAAILWSADIPLHAQTPWQGFLQVPAGLIADDVPLQWTPQSVAWQRDIQGYGQSSPVIWGKQVYVTAVSGSQKEKGHVIALDLADGRVLWQHDFVTASGVPSSPYVSRAAPTPVAGPTGVVCFFEGGDLLALDHDGSVLWERNLVEEYGPIVTPHGLASSLAADESRVFVWVERKENPYLMAIDPQTGKNLWKVEREGSTAWSSPVVAEMPGGGSHVVLSAAGSLVGYDPVDGSELWRLKDLEGNSAPTPRSIGPGRLLIGASVGREGGASPQAVATNGLVEVEPIENVDQQSTTRWRAAYRWQSQKATCSFSSPTASDRYAYFVARGGILYCLDLDSGEQVYLRRLPHDCWATALRVGERIYLFGKDGETTVISTGGSYQVLANNALWDKDSAPRWAPSAPGSERSAAGPEAKAEPAAARSAGRPGGPAAASSPGPVAMASGPVQYAAAVAPGTLVLRTGSRVYAIRL